MKFKRGISIFLFRYENKLEKLIKLFIMISSISVFGMMIYRYGFNHSQENISMILLITRSFYLVFILGFLFRFLISKVKSSFLRTNLLELILILLVIYDSVSYYFFGHPVLERLLIRLGIENYREIYDFFIQFFLLIFVAIEFVKSINSVYTSKLKPTTLFILSFLILITLGGILLTLPGFNTTGNALAVDDAFFTSVSAGCVTGLTVVNTATFFNLKGQLIILFLMQIGGIGILTFASFFATFIKKGIGVKHQIAMNELLDSENISGSYFLLKRILLMTFVIETIGSIGIYILWGNFEFSSAGTKIYYSIFHSISAFCNAGFSILDAGFETPLASELYSLHLFMGVLIFLGGLGFPVLRDVFSPQKMRERLKEPWRDWKMSTKVAVYTSFILILVGLSSFYFIHVSRVYRDETLLNQFAISFFQSVNLRTSGFNSINLGELPVPLMMISMFLMFIGASSASTGGGIKTSTFVVMMVAVIGTIRGKKEMTLGRRTIAKELIYKAFAVVIFSALFVLLEITLLSFFEPHVNIINLAYEAVSAFATVGLSTGITPELSTASKFTLMASMFVGRVGIITLAFSLSTKAIAGDYRLATTHMMIG